MTNAQTTDNKNTTLGRSICLEGLDLTGKSTMAQRLVEWLKPYGIPTLHTRHPGATQIGKKLRELIADPMIYVDPHTRALLFAADNASYINNLLRPAIENGTWVISDRNDFISSLAYQVADGCSLEMLDAVHAATYPFEHLPKIDLLFILQIDYDTACQRRQSRSSSNQSETYETKMSRKEYFDRIANAYDRMLEDQTERLLRFVHHTSDDVVPEYTPRCLYIDATKSQDFVFNQITEAVKPLLGEKAIKLSQANQC